MKRRKEDHDYHGKRFYMITLAVEGRHPILGHLESRNEHTYMVLSPLGEAIQKEWMHISSIYPQIAVIALQVMPDHLHSILYVREHTDFHLGQVIKGFKLGCNRELRKSIMVAMESQPTSDGKKTGNTSGEKASKGEVEALIEEQTTGCNLTKGMPLSLYATISSQHNDKATLWEQGYNDRILHNYNTLEKWKKHLRENVHGIK